MKRYKLQDANLTIIDFISGHPFIEPPLINLLATTISDLFKKCILYIFEINLILIKSSAGYTILQALLDFFKPLTTAEQGPVFKFFER